MTQHLIYPKLRWPIDLRLERYKEQEVLIVQCPLGIAPQPLALISAVAPIVQCFEGTLSVEEIVEKFKEHGLQRSIVEQLVAMLDDGLFLAGPKYFAAETQARQDFLRSTERPAVLSGQAYSADPKRLELDIDGYLEHSKDLLNSPSLIDLATNSVGSMIGLVAPHIDYARGGICYGVAYSRLLNAKHDLYVLIGTAHQYSKHLFHLTRKNFHSPLGAMPCNTRLVSRLADLYGNDRSFADELLHRREHSLELQLPFLQRVVGNAQILPILVGSFYKMLSSGKFPEEYDEYESFAASLAECLKDEISSNKKICFIAGVDMAHVGRSFGDTESLSKERMFEIERRDREYIETLITHDKKALFSHIASDQDHRRICGFPTMYTVIDVLKRLGINYQGRLFDYRQAVDYERECAVTFCGLGMYQNS